MDKTTTWVFECDSFRIGYKKTIHKPDKCELGQVTEPREPKLIEEGKFKLIDERRIDTYA